MLLTTTTLVIVTSHVLGFCYSFVRACVRTAKFCKHATLSNLGKSNVVNA